eukprot:s3111_g2.t1
MPAVHHQAEQDHSFARNSILFHATQPIVPTFNSHDPVATPVSDDHSARDANLKRKAIDVLTVEDSPPAKEKKIGPHVPPTLFQAMPFQQDQAVGGPSHESRSLTETSTTDHIAPTGGLNAFSSTRTMPTISHLDQGEVCEQAALPTEATVTVPSWSQQLAADLVAKKLIVFDLHSLQFQSISTTPNQTVSDLKRAHQTMTSAVMWCYDVVGQPLPDDRELADLPMVLISDTEWNFTDTLFAKTLSMLGKARHDNLHLQGAAVASDEMRFYLQGLQHMGRAQVVDPLIITDLDDAILMAEAWRLQFCSTTSVPLVSAILFNGHWAPVVAIPCDQALHWATNSFGESIWPLMFPFMTIPTKIQHELQSQFSQDCGFQTFAWIKSLVMVTPPQSMTIDEAANWRFLFWQHLVIAQVRNSTEWITLGGQTELETALAAILREHGVFPDRALDRARQVIQQIGITPLTHAINATRPWASIKELANSQTPKLRLIWEDEFSKVVQSRTNKNQAISTHKKPHRLPPTSQAVFTAADVAVPEGVFCQANGSVLAQIAVRNITPSAKGVVLLSETECQPFLSQKNMSKESLALIVLAPFSEALLSHGEPIRFPAQCTRTGEPVLLNGVLIQKGQSPVKRLAPSHPVQVETVKSQTIKILAYKDQLECSWEEFCDRPIRAMLDALPCLKICKISECNCSCWHAESGSPEPILDIWQRDFLSIHFKKAKAKEAMIFSCMLRVTEEAFALIAPLSGVGGLYIEARTPDGKGQDPAYHTMWLNKSTFEASRAFQTTVSGESSLVRVSQRFGLRVPMSNAKQVHDMIRPDVPFLWWHFKDNLARWPSPSADKSGLKWQVLATSDPPSYVYTLSHGDVLIVKAEPNEIKISAMSQVEASAHSCKAVPTAALNGDPWADAASKLPSVRAANQPASEAQIAAMESSIEQRLLKRLQSNTPDTEMTSDYDPRIQALESQVQQSQKDQQVLAQQQGALGKQVESIGQQVESNSSKLQHHLDERLNDQMQRIEALLNKRARQE